MIRVAYMSRDAGNMDNLLLSVAPKKSNSPAPSKHQLPRAPQLMVESQKIHATQECREAGACAACVQ